MENSTHSMQSSLNYSVRHRKSIFPNDKPKADDQDPKLFINGQTFQCWHSQKSSTQPQFYQPSQNFAQQMHHLRQSKIFDKPRKIAASFHLPDRSVDRVIITSSNQPVCVRPSSMGKRSVIINHPQIIQRPVLSVLSQSRILCSPRQILTTSKIIPSQTSNFATPNIIVNQTASNLKRRCILVEGRPQGNMVFRHQTINPKSVQIVTKSQPIQIVNEVKPQINRVVIQDDLNTISELNKISSLNQFLSQQYSLANNQLNYIKARICPKQVVQDNVFLEKSVNRIDNIFLRETNQALTKLNEISRCSSSKGFSKKFNSRIKQQHFPSFNKSTHQQFITSASNVFTPIKEVQRMQNSSYFQCKHIDQASIEDQEV